MPLRGIGTLTESSVSQTSVPVNNAPSIQVGDWLFAVIGSPCNADAGTHDLTVPASGGWTEIAGAIQSSATTSTLAHPYIFMKKVETADLSVSQYIFPFTGTNPQRTYAAKMYAYSGLDATNPIDDLQQSIDASATDLNFPLPSVTTEGANRLIIRLPMTRELNTFPQLSGYTELDEVSGNYHCWSWQEATQASAGASGALTIDATAGGTATEYVGTTIALIPADGGPAAPTEDLVPSGAPTTQTGLTGAYTAIDDIPDPALDDGDWMTGTDPSGSGGGGGISLVASADNGGQPTTSTTVVIPATVQNGDILTVAVVNGDGTAQPSISDNSGVGNWTDNNNGGVVRHQAGTAMAGTVFWKRVTNAGAEAGATISLSGMTGSTCANVNVRRGCIASGSPIDGTPVSEGNAAGNETQAGITTLTNDALVVLALFASDNTASFGGYSCTSPGALTQGTQITSSGGSDSGLATASAIKAAAGATGAFTWTQVDQVSVSIAYALKPAASTPGATTPTEVIVPLSDPVAETPDAAADGTLAMLVRKLGNGVTGGNPTVIGELREGTTVRGSITSQTVSGEHRFSVLVDQSTIVDWTNLNFRMRSDGVSGALVELGAARFTMTGESAAPDTTPPAAPSGLVATDGSGQVSLDWDTHPDTDGDLVGFNVYRATSSGGTFTKINGSLVTFSDYVDTVAGGTYFYKVTAVDTSNNESGFSNEDSGVSSAPGATCVSRRIGALTDDGFIVAGQFSGATTVALRVSVNSDLSSPVGDFSASAPDAQGYTKATASGLNADTQYYFGWVLNSTLVPVGTGAGRGQVKTLPTAGAATSFGVAIASCVDSADNVEGNSTIFSEIETRNPRMLFHMGDKHYQDLAITQTSESSHRAVHEDAITRPLQASLYSKIAESYVYSDHDFAGNNSSSISAGAAASRAVHVQLYPDYPLVADYDTGGTRTDNAIDRAVQIGRIHFFHMDTRTESTDRAATDDASKTKLGSAQKTRLKNWLNHSSRKTMPKVIITQEPWHSSEGTGDSWSRYTTERTELVNYISANGITNVVFVSGDGHFIGYQRTGTPGGWPAYQAAPFAQDGGIKGGPWEVTVPTGTTAAESQCGWMAFTDSGGNSITMVFTGFNSAGGTVLTAPTHTFTNLVASTRITKDLNLSWKVASRVTKDLQLQWKTALRITKDINLPWKVAQRVTKDLNLQWNVAGATSRITKDLNLRWTVKAIKDTDIRLTWPTPPQELIPGADLQNFHIEVRKVGSGVNPRLTAYLYENGSQVATGGVMRLNVPFSDPVGETFVASFDAANLSDITGAGVELRVLLTGDNDGYGELVDVEWNALHVGTAATRINKDLNLQWKVAQRVTKDLNLQWTVLNRVTKDLNISWKVQPSATGTETFPFTGTDGTPWPYPWEYQNGATIQGGRGRLTKPASFWGEGVAYYDDLTSVQNIEHTGTIYPTAEAIAAGESYLMAPFRYDWVAGDVVRFDIWLGAGDGNGGAWIDWIDNGVQQAAFGWMPFVFSAGVGVKWRFKAQGTDVRWKLWPEGQAEPAAWGDIVQFTALTGPGRFAILYTDGTTAQNYAEVDNVTINLAPASEVRITKDLQLRWGISTRITKDLNLSWKVSTRVSKDLQLRWGIASRITKDLNLPWKVATRVTKDLNLQWNVAGITTTRITKDLNLSWKVATRVNKDLTLQWRTALRLTKDLNLSWRVQQRVTKDINLPWKVALRVNKDLQLQWRVSSRITKDINLRWSVADVPGRISKDLQLQWRVYQRVTKDLQLRWGIATRVTKDLRLDWRVAERKTKDFQLQWRVQERVTKDLNLRWNTSGVVLTRITKDLNLRWTVITRVNKDLVLRWEVDSEELVLIIKGQVAPKIKVSGHVAPKIKASWRVAPKLKVAGQVREKIHVSGQA